MKFDDFHSDSDCSTQSCNIPSESEMPPNSLHQQRFRSPLCFSVSNQFSRFYMSPSSQDGRSGLLSPMSSEPSISVPWQTKNPPQMKNPGLLSFSKCKSNPITPSEVRVGLTDEEEKENTNVSQEEVESNFDNIIKRLNFDGIVSPNNRLSIQRVRDYSFKSLSRDSTDSESNDNLQFSRHRFSLFKNNRILTEGDSCSQISVPEKENSDSFLNDLPEQKIIQEQHLTDSELLRRYKAKFQVKRMSRNLLPTSKSSSSFTEEQKKNTIKNEIFFKKEKEPLEGFLLKKAHRWNLGWQKRRVVLEKRKLKYYKREKKGRHKGEFTKLRGVIDFDLVSCKLFVEDHDDPLRFSIEILATHRSFQFKCPGYDEFRKWVKRIMADIEHSKGQIRPLTKVAIQKNFWKYPRCTEREFAKVATTGDVLLFQGRTLSSKFYTYDHVALILKYKNGRVCLFEATGQHGVDICEWSDFLLHKWHLLYPRLVWRKLNFFDRKPETLRSLETFVKNSRGKKYRITTGKLMKRRSSTDYGQEVGDKRNFFCSELVACAYKLMGLLPPHISCTQYWPGSFSSRKCLPLLKGAELGEETLIDFSL